MELQIFYNILAGLIFFGACSLAFARPESPPSFDPIDGIQNDDEYDYSDDAPSSHTKSTVATPTLTMAPFFKKNNLTVITIVGKNATLQCDAENLSNSNVILWSKNGNLLTSGKQVLTTGYTLDQTNFALTIVNASKASEGEYICEVLPEKIHLHTMLVVSEHPIEAIIPESSKSSQESLHFKSKTMLFTSSVIGIFLFLRI